MTTRRRLRTRYQKPTEPEPVTGPPGRVTREDANALAGLLDGIDLAYLDPPYNQHRYFANYHVWETLVRWDDPPHYGVACKRSDCRDPANRSVFNSRPQMGAALAAMVEGVDAEVVVVSVSDEGYVSAADVAAMCVARRWLSLKLAGTVIRQVSMSSAANACTSRSSFFSTRADSASALHSRPTLSRYAAGKKK